LHVSELTVPAEESQLARVRDFVKEFADRGGVPRRTAKVFLLAADEACSNVVRHAYREKGGKMRITLSIARGWFEMAVADRGETFDWPREEALDLRDHVRKGKRGGLGLTIIRRLMDEVSYEANGDTNTLKLRKRIGSAARTAAGPTVQGVKR